jgi:hypothetical protein
MLTHQQKLSLLEVAKAIVESVKAGGDQGAPGGVLYAATMGMMNLSQFESIMGTLVERGYLRKSGQLYFHVKDL